MYGVPEDEIADIIFLLEKAGRATLLKTLALILLTALFVI